MVSGEFDLAEQIEDEIVSRTQAGAPIHLHDLGLTVRRDYEDPPRRIARFGTTAGTAPCIVIAFTMKDGVRVTDIGREVRELVTDLQVGRRSCRPTWRSTSCSTSRSSSITRSRASSSTCCSRSRSSWPWRPDGGHALGVGDGVRDSVHDGDRDRHRRPDRDRARADVRSPA